MQLCYLNVTFITKGSQQRRTELKTTKKQKYSFLLAERALADNSLIYFTDFFKSLIGYFPFSCVNVLLVCKTFFYYTVVTQKCSTAVCIIALSTKLHVSAP